VVGSDKAQEIVNWYVNVFCDLTEQYRGNIAALVKRYGCVASIGMPVLFVGTALAYFYKTECF